MRLTITVILITISLGTFAQEQPKDTSHYFKSFDNRKIYYETWGHGTPVLLVHGFIVNGSSWKKTALFKLLLQQGHQLIIPDLRGNGKSDKPHDSSAYANDAEAKDLIGIMDELKISKYAVIGYSRGSIITARLLVMDKRITMAVMGGMGTDFTNPQWPRRLQFYHALRGDSVPELSAMINYVIKSGLDRQALACMQQEQPSTALSVLSQFQGPVLAISGDKDSDNGSSGALAAVFPHGVAATVPGEHNTTWNSEPFANRILAFLQSGK